MKSIKNFFNTVFEIIIETRKLKAEQFAKKYSNI
jgi:hypothetical protein